MPALFLEKPKITLLYKYYLFGDLTCLEQEKEAAETEKQQAKIDWLFNCLTKEEYLINKIESKLKIGWSFSRLPPLEKATLIYATHEILFNSRIPAPSLITQIIHFSKKYLESDKYKYINKILDLLFKEKQKII